MDDQNTSPEAEMPPIPVESEPVTPPADSVESAVSPALDQMVTAVTVTSGGPGTETKVEVHTAPAGEAPASDTAPPQPNADQVIPSTNTTQTYPVYLDEQVNELRKPEEDAISVLQVHTERAIDILENHSDKDKSIEAARWEHILRQSLFSHPIGLQFDSTVQREGAKFRQYIQTEKGEIGIAVPRFDDRGALLRGEAARLRVRALLGMGSLKTVALPHSGFHVTLKTPSDSSLLELRRLMQEDKIEFGRRTHGLIFSNVSSYWNGRLLDLAMAHVHNHTVKDHSDIRDLILTPDLPILFWGLAATIWPQGFHYTKADLTTDGKIKKTFQKGLININKICWTDNAQLTDQQAVHMSNRTPYTMTMDQIRLYRSQFKLAEGRVIEVGATDNPIKVTLKTPSALDYIRSGHRWIESLVTIVDRTFTSAADNPNAREAAILEHANATIMRQYGHWISAIEFAGSAVLDDLETVEAVINSLGEHDETRNKLLQAISQFIDDVTVSLIGIPESNAEYKGPENFPRIIPLDVISAFFILLMQRTEKHMTE